MIEIGSLKFTGSLGKTAGKTISRENGRMNSTPFHTGEEQSIEGWRNYGEFSEFQGLLKNFSLNKSIKKKNSEHNLTFKGWMAQHQNCQTYFQEQIQVLLSVPGMFKTALERIQDLAAGAVIHLEHGLIRPVG